MINTNKAFLEMDEAFIAKVDGVFYLQEYLQDNISPERV